jgi:hypothetical protein
LRAAEKALRAGPLEPPELASNRQFNRHILENTARLNAISKSIARWTIAQKFWIIGAGSHTVYCVPAAELF